MHPRRYGLKQSKFVIFLEATDRIHLGTISLLQGTTLGGSRVGSQGGMFLYFAIEHNAEYATKSLEHDLKAVSLWWRIKVVRSFWPRNPSSPPSLFRRGECAFMLFGRTAQGEKSYARIQAHCSYPDGGLRAAIHHGGGS